MVSNVNKRCFLHSRVEEEPSWSGLLFPSTLMTEGVSTGRCCSSLRTFSGEKPPSCGASCIFSNWGHWVRIIREEQKRDIGSRHRMPSMKTQPFQNLHRNITNKHANTHFLIFSKNGGASLTGSYITRFSVVVLNFWPADEQLISVGCLAPCHLETC